MTDFSTLVPLAAPPSPILVVIAIPDPTNPALRRVQLLPATLLPGGSGGGGGVAGVLSFNGREGVVTLDAEDVEGLTLGSGSAEPYTLPPATTSTLGGVRPDGTSITVAGGIISAAPSIRPVVTVAASGAAQVLTAAARGDIVYDITLTANCALTLAGGAVGQEQMIRAYLRQDQTAGRTATMPPNVKWVNNGLPPTFDTSPGGFGRVDFTTPDEGVTWAGSY